MRRQLLKEMYDKMSEEDKHLYGQMRIERELQSLREEVRQGGNTFAKDLFANISGNFISYGIIWLGSRLLRR